MKCTIPEISWHNRDPVLSIDIQPGKPDNDGPYRLASGGTDSHVLIWQVCIMDSGVATVEFAADLQRHQRAVNVVRFSPSGEFLASGDDESAIIIWKQKTEQDASEFPGSEGDSSKEQWLTVRMLRGHMEDVYDLSWSLDSSNLISGSVDNTAILWDVHKGRNMGILKDQGGFVQGVSWDPKNQYVATLSSDRMCRIYNVATKKVVCRVSKARLPVPDGSVLDGKVVRLFHDDTLKSFFRRLSFSPDGEILVTPSGLIEMPDTDKHCNATYLFTRSELNRPVAYLPSPNQYTVAVRFCPILFELHEGDSMFALPYRMVLAVATQCSVVLYDTQQAEPFAIISNIHYTRLTDMSWSSDGRMLMISSTDGYCSIVVFSSGELGKVYQPKDDTVQTNSEAQNSVSDVQDKEIKAEDVPELVSDCETVRQEKEMKTKELNKEYLNTNNTNGNVKAEVSTAEKPIKRICPIAVPKTGSQPTKGPCIKDGEKSSKSSNSGKSIASPENHSNGRDISEPDMMIVDSNELKKFSKSNVTQAINACDSQEKKEKSNKVTVNSMSTNKNSETLPAENNEPTKIICSTVVPKSDGEQTPQKPLVVPSNSPKSETDSNSSTSSVVIVYEDCNSDSVPELVPIYRTSESDFVDGSYSDVREVPNSYSDKSRASVHEVTDESSEEILEDMEVEETLSTNKTIPSITKPATNISSNQDASCIEMTHKNEKTSEQHPSIETAQVKNNRGQEMSNKACVVENSSHLGSLKSSVVSSDVISSSIAKETKSNDKPFKKSAEISPDKVKNRNRSLDNLASNVKPEMVKEDKSVPVSPRKPMTRVDSAKDDETSCPSVQQGDKNALDTDIAIEEEANRSNETLHTTPRKSNPSSSTSGEDMDVDESNSAIPRVLSSSQEGVKPSPVTPGGPDKRTPRRVQFITIASPKSKKKLL